MIVPGPTETASLLLSLDPPTWFLRHSRAVAEIAGVLAARAELAAHPLDRRPVKAVALLHDIAVPAVRSRAERLEARVCGAPGIRPRDAGRPVWTDASPRAATT